MKETLIKEYNNLNQLNLPSKKVINTFNFNFIKGAFLEVSGSNNIKYKVNFINHKTGKILYTCDVNNNMWTRANIEYFVKWRIEVINKETNEIDFQYLYDNTDKRVYIHLDSSAIGDTLAWFPYVEEFRKKHNCKVICSTFHNEWFKDKYPEIEFSKPGNSRGKRGARGTSAALSRVREQSNKN